MNVVIDTNVIASARFFGGKPRKLIWLLMSDRYDAYVSEEIIKEYNETDAQLKEYYPDKPVSFSLEGIISKMHQIDTATEVRVCRDPDDDKFIGCAIDSKSKYIVSGDKDLLAVGRHEDVEIVTVADFLKENFPND